jgi:hypothetical protein
MIPLIPTIDKRAVQQRADGNNVIESFISFRRDLRKVRELANIGLVLSYLK